MSDDTTKLRARFWKKVDKAGPIPSHAPELGPCWVWTAGKFTCGYGCIGMNGLIVGAHRVSWELAHGRPPSAYVLHRCDNRACVNPDHLYEGTQHDNMRDMFERGRQRPARGPRNGARMRPDRLARGDRNGAHTKPECVLRGEEHGRSKFTDAQVVEIRRRYALGGVAIASLARENDVSRPTMSRLIRRVTWASVE